MFNGFGSVLKRAKAVYVFLKCLRL